MNLRTPCLVLIVALSFLAGYASTQERTASQPFSGATDVTSPALMQKISYLTQVNHTLQTNLTACRNGEAPPAPTEKLVENNGDFTTKQVASLQGDNDSSTGTSTRTSMQYTAPVAPSRRVGGAIQQAAEPKLTCDDYSLSYFSRHPAMAAVCEKTAQLLQPTPTVVPVLAVTPTVTFSSTATTSASQPLRPRLFSTSGTIPVIHR